MQNNVSGEAEPRLPLAPLSCSPKGKKKKYGLILNHYYLCDRTFKHMNLNAIIIQVTTNRLWAFWVEIEYQSMYKLIGEKEMVEIML